MIKILNNPYIDKVLFTFLVLLLAILLSKLLTRSIDLIFNKIRPKIVRKEVIAKTQTVKLVLNNIIKVSIILIAILTIIAQWGVNIGPILTGAGILGLAITLGSQSLIKDFLAGFFIIAEDQFNVGEKVKIGEHTGYVHRITLRLTVLKDDDGNLIYIPNSQIIIITRLKED